MDGEAHFVESVGGEVAGFGVALLLVFGFLVLGVAAVEEVDACLQSCGVFIEPAVVVEGIGVGFAGGEDFPGTIHF